YDDYLKNWKVKNAEVIIAPPFPFIAEVKKIISGVAVAAQNAFWEREGAYTGEVSPLMLKRVGAEYVILGHSERRRVIGETDDIINKKILAALNVGLKVILCIGEPLETRKKGVGAIRNYLKNQLIADLRDVKKTQFSKLIIAYEPIWAIGTGRYDIPTDAQGTAIFIKGLLAKKTKTTIPFLYGGSVDSKNAKYFIQLKEIDGALVGRASLNASEFFKIIKSIND
ncbi:triose-phosphate isomerase, partial [Patescibacteria group bacterium]|nr:triose-phosphate isomerase [Patescibacteria group bacterium]